MEKQYDVVVVGAATAGSYFAKRMSENGLKVLAIDRLAREEAGKRLAVFHVDEELFGRFGVPKPQKGDPEYLTVFKESYSRSALDRYQKTTRYPFQVMRMHEFVERLISWAQAYGAEYSFCTEFQDFTYDDGGRISGVTVLKDGKTLNIGARLVADCSGIPAAGRTKLRDGCGVENFVLSPKDQFYVVLRYVRLRHPERDKVTTTTNWPYYKTWIAPSPEPDGAVIGVGANHSFEYAEKCYANFEKSIPLPEHELVRIEKGSTPYRRPPYSFVADRFIALGDAACITKPYSGEGVTAAWTLVDIASNVIPAVLKAGEPTREKLWKINVRYARTQGADFANLLASLTGAVNCTKEENDYEFKHSIIFDDDIMTRMNRAFANKMTPAELTTLVGRVIGGVLGGKIKIATVTEILKYSAYAGSLEKLYRVFPASAADFPQWERKANALWAKVGSMADKCVL